MKKALYGRISFASLALLVMLIAIYTYIFTPSQKTITRAQGYTYCTDECSPSGAKDYQCNGVYVQSRTCGDYDSDTCLEWSGYSNCYDCSSLDSASANTVQDTCTKTYYTCSDSSYGCNSGSCGVDSTSTVYCDSYDDTNGGDGTLTESEVSSSTCSLSCSGSGCCDVRNAVCDSSHECEYVTSIISSSFLDEVSPSFRCHRTNSGSWEWTTSSLPAETACHDGYDNDCNGKIDCQDTSCSPNPPTTTASATTNGNSYSFNTWTKYDVTVTLTATDDCWVDKTYYCIDSSNTCTPSTEYSSPFTVSCSSNSVCVKYVRFYSTDNVFNLETVHSDIIRIDKQAPYGNISYLNVRTGVINDTITSADMIKFIISADDFQTISSGIDRIELYITGRLRNGTMLTDSLVFAKSGIGGVKSITVESGEIGQFAYNQNITYYAVIYDVAGNSYTTPKEEIPIHFGVVCSSGSSTRITGLMTWDASSEIYSNSGGMCGSPSKVKEVFHTFPVDYSYGRYSQVSNVKIYNITDLIAYAPSEDYCVWVDKYGNYECHPVGETFNLDNNYEVQPRDYIDTRLASCLKGTGVVNDNPVLVSSSEVPEGFVFLPSNEHYFHVMWNVNYSTNPRLVGIKCYFNPHKTDAYGHIYWCTFDEIENGSCPEYQLCECSSEWPCYQDTRNQTRGTCTVLNPKYLVNVTGVMPSGWPIVQFVENKIFCKFYDPNFENESYTWYNHNFTPIAFSYEFTLPNNTQLVVGSNANIKLRITNNGVIEDTYNITVSTDSPALTITPSDHETTSVESNDYADVYFSLRPNYALSSTPVHATFTICSEKMQDILSKTSSDTRKACKEHVLAFNIKMVTMDDNPFSWLFRKVFKNN